MFIANIRFDTLREYTTVTYQNRVYDQYMVVDNQIAYGEDMVVVGYVACNPPVLQRVKT